MKLMALAFVRTSEPIGARWAEFDLDNARWDIPTERMKMRTPHIVLLLQRIRPSNPMVYESSCIKVV
jgi:integrase